ncbi:hypothetical protein JXB28_03840 [Candidatus Woesearchaeota archaeon]|nr:hypothetical protein [Candidatus Woesearchaeota archaeon]
MKNKKALFFGLVVLGVLMGTSLASAYTSSYSSYGYGCGWTGNCATTYSYQQPARIGGWFGQSLSYVSTPLRANYYQQPCLSTRPPTYYVSSCGSCGTWGYTGSYTGSYYGGSSYSSSYRYPSYNYGYRGIL